MCIHAELTIQCIDKLFGNVEMHLQEEASEVRTSGGPESLEEPSV